MKRMADIEIQKQRNAALILILVLRFYKFHYYTKHQNILPIIFVTTSCYFFFSVGIHVMLFFSTGLDYYGIFPRIFSSTSYARIFFSGCLNSLRYLHKNHGRDRACDENDVSWPKIPRNDSDQDSNPDCSIRSVKYGFSVKTNSKLKIIEVTFQVKKNKPMDTRLS